MLLRRFYISENTSGPCLPCPLRSSVSEPETISLQRPTRNEKTTASSRPTSPRSPPRAPLRSRPVPRRPVSPRRRPPRQPHSHPPSRQFSPFDSRADASQREPSFPSSPLSRLSSFHESCNPPSLSRPRRRTTRVAHDTRHAFPRGSSSFEAFPRRRPRLWTLAPLSVRPCAALLINSRLLLSAAAIGMSGRATLPTGVRRRREERDLGLPRRRARVGIGLSRSSSPPLLSPLSPSRFALSLSAVQSTRTRA